MMVSDFLCEETGTLRLTEEAKVADNLLPEAARLPEMARVVIYPSSRAGGDKYWNMDQMMAQVSRLCLKMWAFG